ncbi:unnamed protein product, partial [Rotaria sp. Silwood1]
MSSGLEQQYDDRR